jgi:hypothetical protein
MVKEGSSRYDHRCDRTEENGRQKHRHKRDGSLETIIELNAPAFSYGSEDGKRSHDRRVAQSVSRRNQENHKRS